jgi:hypothetical protein
MRLENKAQAVEYCRRGLKQALFAGTFSFPS